MMNDSDQVNDDDEDCMTMMITLMIVTTMKRTKITKKEIKETNAMVIVMIMMRRLERISSMTMKKTTQNSLDIARVNFNSSELYGKFGNKTIPCYF